MLLGLRINSIADNLTLILAEKAVLLDIHSSCPKGLGLGLLERVHEVMERMSLTEFKAVALIPRQLLNFSSRDGPRGKSQLFFLDRPAIAPH